MHPTTLTVGAHIRPLVWGLFLIVGQWHTAAVADAPSEQRIRQLLHDLRDGPPGKRNRAAQQLYNLQHPRGNAGVERLAADSDPGLRAIGCWALSVVRPPARETILLQRLSDRSPTVRRAAVDAVGALQLVAAAAQLRRLLRDDDPVLRQRTIWALSQLGAAGLAGLRHALWHGTLEHRLLAVRAVGAVTDAKARTLLLQITRKGPPVMQVMAAHELISQGDQNGYRALRRLLGRSRDKGIRLQAVRGLATDPSRASRRALRSALRDKDAQVRRAAADALASRE